MTDQIISYPTAKLAKEKGFDWETKHWYDQTECLNPTKGIRGAMVYTNMGFAPTQSLLAKWLREKHNIHTWVLPWNDTSMVCYITKRMRLALIDDLKTENFETYESALEEGLIKALELI